MPDVIGEHESIRAAFRAVGFSNVHVQRVYKIYFRVTAYEDKAKIRCQSYRMEKLEEGLKMLPRHIRRHITVLAVFNSQDAPKEDRVERFIRTRYGRTIW